ncbi:GNAT family N-acetyltransferase, partial [Klebsiella quasipneumoniae]|uniref:GNAT family N-acetyltransferase n=1 Tax=Klebsiella quasipneumoniae TaxID=1463165 RepID=UPI001D186808
MHIETHRLRLRPVMAEDVADLYRIYGDPATNTFNPAGPYPDIDYASTVIQRWLAHWHDRGFGNWAISARDAPEKIIGFGGLTIRRYNDVTLNNLGYRFATEAWGKGLATE